MTREEPPVGDVQISGLRVTEKGHKILAAMNILDALKRDGKITVNQYRTIGNAIFADSPSADFESHDDA